MWRTSDHRSGLHQIFSGRSAASMTPDKYDEMAEPIAKEYCECHDHRTGYKSCSLKDAMRRIDKLGEG